MINSMLMCLALNVYHEARGEPMIGQYAVAHVVINRVQDDMWPDDVCSVVKDGYRKGNNKCAFSWYCDGQSDKPTEARAWLIAQNVAADVLSGAVEDITYGSTHYHATYVRPWWAKHYSKTVSYGSHIFYR